jgi:hypothetical protein
VFHVHFDLCSECGRLTTEGLVCDSCVHAYEVRTEDDLTISEMAAASYSHALPEQTARYLGLQLDNPLA